MDATSPNPIEPSTPEDWQAAVNAAHLCLAMDAARSYGLITWNRVVDIPRCEDLLARGAARGYHPTVLVD